MVAKFRSITSQCDSYVGCNILSDLDGCSASSNSVFCDGSWTSCRNYSGLAAIFLGDGADKLIQAISSAHHHGIRCSRDAEGEALLLGLHLAIDLNLASVRFFSDSVEVVSALFNGFVQGQ